MIRNDTKMYKITQKMRITLNCMWDKVTLHLKDK